MSQTVQQDKKRRGWIWLVGIGIVVAVIGIIIGFQTAGRLCGGVFRPSSPAAEYYDLMGGNGGMASCNRSIAAMAVPTWILIVIGIVMVLTAILVRSIGNYRPTSAVAPVAPSVAAQIEDLSRLKGQGLISDEEFNTKRAELLSRF